LLRHSCEFVFNHHLVDTLPTTKLFDNKPNVLVVYAVSAYVNAVQSFMFEIVHVVDEHVLVEKSLLVRY